MDSAEHAEGSFRVRKHEVTLPNRFKAALGGVSLSTDRTRKRKTAYL